jgi:hypothetical protein
MDEAGNLETPCEFAYLPTPTCSNDPADWKSRRAGCARLPAIADKCPVHRTLESHPVIRTRVAQGCDLTARRAPRHRT